MTGAFLIIALTLFVGILIARPLLNLLSRFWQVEFKHPAESSLEDNPDLWRWMVYYLSLLLRGKWKIRRADQAFRLGESSSIPLSGDTDDLYDQSRATLPEQAKEVIQSQVITNFQLTFDLPVGKHVQIEVEAKSFEDSNSINSIVVEGKRVDTGEPIVIRAIALHQLEPEPGKGQGQGLRQINLSSIFDRSRLGSYQLDIGLFLVALSVYLFTHLVGLGRFPVYFFTDEAIHTILAEELVNNNFRFNGVLLPTYFPIGASFGLNSISVYLQTLPYLLFGKSVLITRAVSVIVTCFGAIAVGLILKNFLRTKYWWSGVLILSITPTWFLHSRTAFEYLEVASFYAIFIYFYLCYRLKSPKYLFVAILIGACVFYAHGLGAILIVVTAILLILTDLPYHWHNRWIVSGGLLMILVVSIPFFRFTRAYPNIFEEQLRMRGSYWLEQNLLLTQKVIQFGKEYLVAFSPKFWFLPENGRDIIRHVMKGYGNISWISLPFILYGFYLICARLRSPAHRVIFISLIASPLGAAAAQISVLRTIWMIIPITIITAYGLTTLLDKLESKHLSYFTLSVSLCLLLSGINLYMWRDAMVNGPRWYSDYGLYGLQYGAQQVFGDVIPRLLDENLSSQVVVTPTWANGTDNFMRFFLTPEQQRRVRLDSVNAFLDEKQPVDGNLDLILTKPEYELAANSPKFQNIRIKQIINYPDGSPGFYVLNLEYSDVADAIFAGEKLVRSQPLDGEVIIDGQPVKIRYSRIDMGQPQAMFDGDVHTLMRGLEANPLVIELYFASPRSIRHLAADFANMDFDISVELFEQTDGSPVVYDLSVRNPEGDPHIDMTFDKGPDQVSMARLIIHHMTAGEKAHIHVRELNFSP